MSVTAIEKKKEFGITLKKMEGEIMKALPKHIRPDVFMRVVTTSVNRNPKLLECTPASLFGAIIQAGQLGLMPDGVLGEAYLIPYKIQGTMTCQYQTGYKGLLKLLRRAGNVANIRANEVYKQDEFEYNELDGITNHRRTQESSFKEEDITHFYCIINYKDGAKDFAVLTRNQVDVHKQKFSKSWQNSDSPWKNNFISMGKKTAIIQAAKYGDMSTEMNTAISLDELAEIGKQRNARVVTDVQDSELNRVFNLDADIEDAQIEKELEDAAKKISVEAQEMKSKAVKEGVQGNLLG